MQTPNHAEREHATWSASSAKRSMLCSGALGLILEVTKDWPESTNEAADWGTCAHQISEACLRDGTDASRFIGQTLKGKKHSFEVDDEMADCAQEFIDYVRQTREEADGWTGEPCPACCGSGQSNEGPHCLSCAGTGDQHIMPPLWIEQRFSFASLKPPFDAGGTGDAVVYKPATKELEVVDLKGGRGVVVEAKGNPQLRSYGLGAVLTHPDLDVETVKVTIVQPRAPHKDGRIRSETFEVGELVMWTSEMLASMRRSKQAMDERAVITGELSEEEWARKWLVPGDHCQDTFCDVAAVCPALRMKVEESIGLHFHPITEEPTIRNSPNVGGPEQIGKYLDCADMIEGWVKHLRAHGHRMAEMGQPPAGYCLVEKTGREAWVDKDAEKKAVAAAEALGLDKSKYLNDPKTNTPKQIREAFKKAKADVSALEGLSSTPSTGTNLVRQDGTIRPAVSAVEQHFQAIKE